jgi:hypothetical protein
MQVPKHDVTDFEIAKKCLDTQDSYAWENTAQDRREELIRWLEGKVRDLEVRSWVLSRTLPKALQAGAMGCHQAVRAYQQHSYNWAYEYVIELHCSVGPKKKRKFNSSTTSTTTTDSDAGAGQ